MTSVATPTYRLARAEPAQRTAEISHWKGRVRRAAVAHERLEDGEHNLSDVIMGAVLGTVIGHSVAQGQHPEFFGGKVVPYTSSQGGTGIAYVKNLP